MPLPLCSLLLLAPLLTASPAAPLRSASGDATAAAITDYLERLEGVGFSGVCLVAQDGELLVERASGLAERERGAANEPGTLFPLHSITKHFTAAAVLRLEMDGALAVDDAIGLYLDDVPEDKRAITLHQLLCHASGLPGALGGLHAIDDPDELARAILSATLLFEPGAGVGYSNPGYTLLSLIVARVAGQPFEQVLRERLFEPAGMRHTGFAAADFGGALQARGTIDDREEGTLLESLGGRVPRSMLGSGGLQSTAGDLLLWSRALRAGTVLDAAALARMTTPHARPGPELAFGYGCGLRASPLGPILEHSGSDDIFSAWIRHWLERDLFVFVASNDADIYADGPLEGVCRILRGESAPDVPRTLRLAPERLAAYTGSWTHEGQDVQVEARADALTLASDSLLGASLLHPLPRDQIERRAHLLSALESAFPSAFAGDAGALHRLLDPYAPFEAFAADTGGLLDELTSRHGPFQGARAIPGRNRFGEIAVIAELAFESGLTRIEYSFGPREVGSIRFLDALPRRVVRPAEPERFVDYDADEDLVWSVRFTLDEAGAPRALFLADESGEAVEFRRAQPR